jgi:hypothetical protein
MSEPTAFPNYMQMTRRVPLSVWHAVRVLSVAGAVAVFVLLLVDSSTGLEIFWRFIIPSLPLLFFVAPGLWRNICPLAAMNQTPRYLGFTRALSTPRWFKEYGYVIAIVLFVAIVASRRRCSTAAGWRPPCCWRLRWSGRSWVGPSSRASRAGAAACARCSRFSGSTARRRW